MCWGVLCLGFFFLTPVRLDTSTAVPARVLPPPPRRRNRSEFSPYGPYGHGQAPAFGGGRGGGIGGSGGPLDMEGATGGVVPSGEQVRLFEQLISAEGYILYG